MVRDLLVDLAREVPDYTDAGGAIRRYRRGRRRRLGGTIAAVAAVVALVAVATFAIRPPSPPLVLASRPPVLTDYPATLTAPDPSAVLPDLAVPNVTLLFDGWCETQCRTVDVTVGVDGRQYDGEPGFGEMTMSLSPDGGWLAVQTQSNFLIRRLADGYQLDTGLFSADGWEPLVWSPQTRYLLMWDGGPNLRRIDLVDGASVSYQAPRDKQVLALLPDGDLLLSGEAKGTEPSVLVRVDPVTRRQHSVVTLHSDQRLPPYDLQVNDDDTTPELVDPTGDRIAVLSRGGMVLDVELATGEVLHRHALPTNRNHAAIAAAYLAEGLLLAFPQPAGASPSELYPGASVGLLDLESGQFRVLTQTLGGRALLLRGGDGWYQF